MCLRAQMPFPRVSRRLQRIPGDRDGLASGMLGAMEFMTVKVLECRPALVGGGMSALVVAFSRDALEGEPVARLLIRLRLPEGATVRDAHDLALKYLDVA